jgi:hypothetical protein
MSVTAALLAGCTPGLGNESDAESADSWSGARPSAGQPSTPPRWVVTLGDSYISGAGARWAGNTTVAPRRVDALGTDAYLDSQRGPERQPGCHRAQESIANLDYADVLGRNLACSGATLRSRWQGATFRPGLDSYSDHAGHLGQVAALRRFAEAHEVTAVVVSIGGNDFGFASVLTRCVAAFVLTVGSQPQHCSNDPDVLSQFDRQRVQAVGKQISAALKRVSAGMERAGYRPEDFRLLALTYPSPVPPGQDMRYPETLQARYGTGGCPLFSADATWAATALEAINTAVSSGVRRSGLPNVSLLDMSRAFVGHRLCERGVGLLEETDVSSWRDVRAVDQLEWVNKINVTWFTWHLQESVHPGYFGMLAERSCVRQVLRRASRPVSRCVVAGDGMLSGEPVMALR